MQARNKICVQQCTIVTGITLRDTCTYPVIYGYYIAPRAWGTTPAKPSYGVSVPFEQILSEASLTRVSIGPPHKTLSDIPSLLARQQLLVNFELCTCVELPEDRYKADT